MMKQSFEYTGPECIDLMKQIYPNSWEDKIKENAAFLLRMQKTWKSPTIEKAYEKYISYAGKAANSIEMLASLQWIKDEENNDKKQLSEKIKSIQELQDKVLHQQEDLEKSEITSEFDKRHLRQYYRELQDQYARELTELTNAIDVIEPEILIIQGNLFREHESQ